MKCEGARLREAEISVSTTDRQWQLRRFLRRQQNWRRKTKQSSRTRVKNTGRRGMHFLLKRLNSEDTSNACLSCPARYRMVGRCRETIASTARQGESRFLICSATKR